TNDGATASPVVVKEQINGIEQADHFGTVMLHHRSRQCIKSDTAGGTQVGVGYVSSAAEDRGLAMTSRAVDGLRTRFSGTAVILSIAKQGLSTPANAYSTTRHTE